MGEELEKEKKSRREAEKQMQASKEDWLKAKAAEEEETKRRMDTEKQMETLEEKLSNTKAMEGEETTNPTEAEEHVEKGKQLVCQEATNIANKEQQQPQQQERES